MASNELNWQNFFFFPSDDYNPFTSIDTNRLRVVQYTSVWLDPETVFFRLIQLFLMSRVHKTKGRYCPRTPTGFQAWLSHELSRSSSEDVLIIWLSSLPWFVSMLVQTKAGTAADTDRQLTTQVLPGKPWTLALVLIRVVDFLKPSAFKWQGQGQQIYCSPDIFFIYVQQSR